MGITTRFVIELPGTRIQSFVFTLIPMCRKFVWESSVQPVCPAGQVKVKLVPFTEAIRFVGLRATVAVTANTPFVGLKFWGGMDD